MYVHVYAHTAYIYLPDENSSHMWNFIYHNLPNEHGNLPTIGKILITGQEKIPFIVLAIVCIVQYILRTVHENIHIYVYTSMYVQYNTSVPTYEYTLP